MANPYDPPGVEPAPKKVPLLCRLGFHGPWTKPTPDPKDQWLEHCNCVACGAPRVVHLD